MERARARRYSVRYVETVRVTSDPPGAAIYVNDVYAGNAPMDAEIVLDPLRVMWPWKFGSGHDGSLVVEEAQEAVVIEAVVRDHHTVRKSLDVTGGAALRAVLDEYRGNPETGSGEATTKVPRTLGATSELHLTLRPLRGPAAGEPARPRTGGPAAAGVDASGASVAAAEGGVVRVTADDESAEVWVDGKFMGNVPAILRLASGDHEIEIRPPGGAPYQRTVTVTPGGEQTLRAPR
jgi:hypothetical protein